MVPATAIPVTVGSWLMVARTPLKDAACWAGMPAAVRCTRAPNPVPWAAPARTSTAVACQGHAPGLVSQARRVQAAAKVVRAACGTRGSQAAGSRVQVTEAVANPAAYPAKVSPEASGLSPRA